MEDPEYGVKIQGSSRQHPTVKNITVNTIPDDILNNEALNKAIATLPSNYSFEIHKTLWRIRKNKSKCVALQFPEGLLMYSCIISDILQTFGHVQTVIMGDVTYGACCIDDLSAMRIGCDFLVHYGHSCLVPVDICQIPALYVFVDIGFNTDHLISMIKTHIAPSTHLILAGTIQFSAAIQSVGRTLKALEMFESVMIPQARPLSQGEVLGCTAPKLVIPTATSSSNAKTSCAQQASSTSCGCETGKESNESSYASYSDDFTLAPSGHGALPDGTPLEELQHHTQDGQEQQQQQQQQQQCGSSGCCDSTSPQTTEIPQLSPDLKNNGNRSEDPEHPRVTSVCVFIADGRFHLESLMIQNPHIDKYLRYDPYNRMLTHESYDHEEMHTRRYNDIVKAKTAKRWGIILGTLGRQGSTLILDHIEQTLTRFNVPFTTILLSEIYPTKLSLLASSLDAFVQIACPRLSIDWSNAFTQVLLNPYEFDVCFGNAQWLHGNGVYNMDYYSNDGGSWTNYYHRQKQQQQAAENLSDKATIISGKSALALIRQRAAAKKLEKQKLEQQQRHDLAENTSTESIPADINSMD